MNCEHEPGRVTVSEKALRNIAYLHLTMAHGADGYLSDVELEAITEHLHTRYAVEDRAVVQGIVMEALAQYLERERTMVRSEDTALELCKHLSLDAREGVLKDLLSIARADGVVLEKERRLLAALAECWDLPDPLTRTPPSQGEDSLPEEGRAWGVLHDLTYVYLVLAHATDHDLSESEVHVILDKLREWQPGADMADVRATLDLALERYAQGADETMLHASIEAVREGLPEAQRMAALNDLVEIANADGVFLDNEEDLINHLVAAWDVGAYASYGKHGGK